MFKDFGRRLQRDIKHLVDERLRGSEERAGGSAKVGLAGRGAHSGPQAAFSAIPNPADTSSRPGSRSTSFRTNDNGMPRVSLSWGDTRVGLIRGRLWRLALGFDCECLYLPLYLTFDPLSGPGPRRRRGPRSTPRTTTHPMARADVPRPNSSTLPTRGKTTRSRARASFAAFRSLGRRRGVWVTCWDGLQSLGAAGGRVQCQTGKSQSQARRHARESAGGFHWTSGTDDCMQKHVWVPSSAVRSESGVHAGKSEKSRVCTGKVDGRVNDESPGRHLAVSCTCHSYFV